MSREIRHIYADPLDAVWLCAAREVGLRVVRSEESYASYDGRGTLSLSESEGMDPDDCLAQMILHELCHALVQGPQSFGWVDWGLNNWGSEDREREHACLRLQAALLQPFGLKRVLAPTTDFRSYYDALGDDPFQERDPSERESIVRARAAFARRRRRPIFHHLDDALARTSAIVAALHEPGAKIASETLYSTAEPPLQKHSAGLPRLTEPTTVCGACAWSVELPDEGSPTASQAELLCLQAGGARVSPDEPSCLHFESPFDCLACGACCREAYDTVEVEPNDPAVRHHLPLLIEREGGYDLEREGARCRCLQGGTALSPPVSAIEGGSEPPDAGQRVAPLFMPSARPFTCSIYATRPRTCRDFTIFSEHCLSARRSVGLSR